MRVEVVTAIITDAQGRFLLQQRGTTSDFAGWWEHPGGKVERGETHVEALRREMREELGIELTSVAEALRLSVSFYPPTTPVPCDIYYYPAETNDTPVIRETQQALAWVTVEDALSRQLTPGSRFVFERIRSHG